ncbi:MAG: ORF6N domain-containing protein [Bacteroidales bacterium]|nr:ORF6N domain-containing protein [Bacteroidales bacterium]NLO51179.1 ORF6N domain-containing protein [Bacteroidales bacterium]
MHVQSIQNKIYEVRGQKVMLDFDLADLYDVETRVLNQAVKRNSDIFPEDFMFHLSQKEWESMLSQTVMTYPVKRPKTALPLAFTEHGVTMLANVLKSKKSRQTSISIVRAFIALKQFALNYREISDKLKELETKYNKQFNGVYEPINFLLQKDKQETGLRECKQTRYQIEEIAKNKFAINESEIEFPQPKKTMHAF